MRGLLTGVILGLALGIFLGMYPGRFSVAVQATSVGFGAGIGVFSLGALVRGIAAMTDKTFSEMKEGKAP